MLLILSAKARLETIQRIGRCLRTDPANPSKSARVIDFVNLGGDEESADSLRHSWLQGLSAVRSGSAGATD